VPRAKHIPLAALLNRMSELDATAPIAVYCASGYRSSIAAAALRAAGFPVVADVLGGFAAWSSAAFAAEVIKRADTPLALPRSPLQRLHDEAPSVVNKKRLTIRSRRPLNGEIPIAALVDGDVVTANTNFYVRNHFSTPVLDPAIWRLHVDGLASRPQALTLRDLHDMTSQSRVVTLECAGNGRAEIGHLTGGVP
jgi:DMSO/TMAO reductase YedYZ molybdopterin-dependent catalytic subunit